ncbi:hypothetical protein [Halostella pelagica]|uniref:hypothetical protein n=1 Tax=Halostella pelagica TaxID=2583824 RepID=UPI001080CF87|nr:hypothetical protein [Halostella pelagica]
MFPERRVPFVRDAVVATAVVTGSYALASNVEFAPLQIPGYLVIVGFGVLEAAFGFAGDYSEVLFAAYLIGLGLAGAVAAAAVRSRADETGAPGWQTGLAGALAVLGSLSLLFALAVLVGTSQWEPVLITGAFGLGTLALAGWLAGAR